MIEKILVPIDSIEWDNTFTGVKNAIGFAKACQIEGEPELILIHVLHAPSDASGELKEEKLELERKRIENEFETVKQMCKKESVKNVRTLIVKGDPEKKKGVDEEIVETAEEEDADLIVMGSGKLQDRSFMGRIGKFVYGSVTEGVIHKAPCSILVARPQMKINKILVPIDSIKWDNTLNAVESSIGFASGCSVEESPELVFMHVSHAGARVPMSEKERVMELKDREMKEEFNNVKEMCKEKGVENLNTLFKKGNPPDEIVETAEEEDVDVIVMGSGKLQEGGIQKFFYGSVTENVIHNAPCSILVTRPS